LATEFRKWSTKIIKDHLVKGYSLSNQIKENQIIELQNKLNNAEELLLKNQTQLTDGLLKTKYNTQVIATLWGSQLP
jgi:hypothetical protein